MGLVGRGVRRKIRKTTMNSQRAPRPRFLRWVLVAAITGIVIVAAVHTVLLPVLVRHRVSQEVARHWAGMIVIDQVRIDYDGPIILEDVSLRDGQGREWAAVRRATLMLANWPGRSPDLVGLELAGAAIRLHREEGAIESPLRVPEEDDEDQTPLRSLALHDAYVEIVDEDSSHRVVKDISLTAELAKGRYDLRLKGRPPQAPNLLTLAGTLDPNEDRLVIDRVVSDVLKGKIEADIVKRDPPDAPAEYDGKFATDALDLVSLMQTLGLPRERARGQLTLDYRFAYRGGDGLRGNGMFLIDDADLLHVPIITHILERIKLPVGQGLSKSDAGGVFSNKGAVVTFREARLANAVSAMETEPGGAVNLQTEHLDFYVIVVPIEGARKLLKSIPIINLFVHLRDRLTRVHVEGRWSDPPATLIRVEPVKDVRDATLGFLRDMVHTGGEFSRQANQDLRNLFSAMTGEGRE